MHQPQQECFLSENCPKPAAQVLHCFLLRLRFPLLLFLYSNIRNKKSGGFMFMKKLVRILFVILIMFTNNDISRYYDLSEVHYRRVWNLDKSRSLHYGYWDESVKNFDEALLNINKVLADYAEIKDGEKVLDVVWAIESVCYANDKGIFLKEANRILKPGGRLIIADFFETNNLRSQDAALVTKWANGWAINSFATAEDFDLKLKANGFENIKWFEATEAIMPSAKKLYRSYFLGSLGAKLYQLFKPNASDP